MATNSTEGLFELSEIEKQLDEKVRRYTGESGKREPKPRKGKPSRTLLKAILSRCLSKRGQIKTSENVITTKRNKKPPK